MSQTLAELFIENKGKPLEIDGKKIVMSHSIEVSKGQIITIELLNSKTEFRQGIELSVDKRKGRVVINGEELIAPVLWNDTAPKIITVKCLPKKVTGQINIWNVWQYTDQTERVDAWIGNAGIVVEQQDMDTFLFRCSNGIGDIDFEDFAFKVKLE